MDANATAGMNSTLDDDDGGNGADVATSWFQPLAVSYTAGVNACSLVMSIVGVALLLLCWRVDSKFFERISLRIVMVLMVDNVLFHINYIRGLYLVTDGACQANVFIYVIFDVFRALMTANLAFHLFYICVLKRTVHRHMFEAYLISAAILSVGIALPSYIVDAVYFSESWGCWYNSAEVAWIFYYGPLIVPCITALILALAVRISMIEHLKLSNAVGSIRTTNLQTNNDAVSTRSPPKTRFSLPPESHCLLPIVSDTPASDAVATASTIRRPFVEFSPCYPLVAEKMPAMKTAAYHDDSCGNAAEADQATGHTIVIHETRSPSIQPLLPLVPDQSSPTRKHETPKVLNQMSEADALRSVGTIDADEVATCAPATHTASGIAGAGVVRTGGLSGGGISTGFSSSGWGVDREDGSKAARSKRRETVRKLEKKYSKPFGLVDADKLSALIPIFCETLSSTCEWSDEVPWCTSDIAFLLNITTSSMFGILTFLVLCLDPKFLETLRRRKVS
ncbi:hypothetical protein HK101_009586 [Irineochytrium annulatum]|nr:hypothetical protein HK101_009586 [Irineochytrium annulatum]